MSRRLRLGISTCPNDTFLFHALLAGEIDTEDLEFEIELLDVQELNEALLRGEYDAAKGSFYCGLELASEVGVLDCGSALGFGVGPLLLGASQITQLSQARRILCPGRWTTANLLLGMFHSDLPAPRQVIFSEIMPALESNEADLGVCIHEGRFTYEQHGLRCFEDLGQRWENATSEALPLGGIFARKALGADALKLLTECLRASLAWGRANRQETLKSMRLHAQELSEEVIWSHVDLYVNEYTHSLGKTGARALAALDREARKAQLLRPDATALEILGQ